LTKRFREVGSVSHQPADCHIITQRISRRNPAARRCNADRGWSDRTDPTPDVVAEPLSGAAQLGRI